MNNNFLMDNYCFACGCKNDNGLKLKIEELNDTVVARFSPNIWMQGYKQIVHGGIISTVLDEMAVWAAYKRGYKSVTAELNVRIKKAMTVGSEYIALGQVTKIKHKLIFAEAKIKDMDDQVIAFAQIKLIRTGS